MKHWNAVIWIVALLVCSCAGPPAKPVGFFAVDGLSVGSSAADVRKVAARLPANNFNSDDVPGTGKGMIASVGEGNTFFVFWDGKLNEYYMIRFGGPEKKYQKALARYSALYGNPNTNVAELPAGSANGHADMPDLLAFWVSPDNSSVLILELSKKDDGVITTLNSLLKDPLNKNLKK